jgi:hypothetical protein
VPLRGPPGNRTRSSRLIRAVPSQLARGLWWTWEVPTLRPSPCESAALPLSYTSKMVVPGVLAPPPPGFRPGAPLSELQNLVGCGRGVSSSLLRRGGAPSFRWTTTASAAPFGDAVPLRRKDSNLRRRWVTATRSPAELLRTVRTGSRHAPGGRMPAFLVCCPPQAVWPTGRTGVRDSGHGDPCRTRTCVRCVRSSRPATRRTGRGFAAEGGGFEPRGLIASAGFRNRMSATPAAPSQQMVSPVRFERTTPAFGGQRSVPLSYGEMAPEARFKLTTGASHAPVLFTTPPGSEGSAAHCGATSDAYGTRTRTFRIDGPALYHRAHAPGGTYVPESGWPESNRRPRRPERRALPACATARWRAREGGDDPPLPGSEPGVLPVTPLPNGAPPEGRTPIRGVRTRSVTSYRRDAKGGGSPARSKERQRLKPRPPGQAEGGTLGTDGWGHRRSTGLPPGYGRRGSNSHGPGPPASEAGASADSATSARGAGPSRLS